MTEKTADRRRPREQAEPPDRVKPQRLDPELIREGPPIQPEQLEETLVADVRSGMRPSQMVDRKLLALLGGSHPGLRMQGTGRPGDVRRAPGI
jgi:hypothetical protein